MGTLYLGRDPRPFLEAVAAVRTRHAITAQDLEVVFVGHARSYRGHSVTELIRKLGLDDLVTVRDWIPHAEALQLVGHADLLLLLAQDQPLQIPNKLYEYLGGGRPILAYVDAGGESERLLNTVGGHWCVTPQDTATGEQCLEWLLGLGPGTSRSPDRSVLEELTTERQMKALLAHVERLT